MTIQMTQNDELRKNSIIFRYLKRDELMLIKEVTGKTQLICDKMKSCETNEGLIELVRQFKDEFLKVKPITDKILTDLAAQGITDKDIGPAYIEIQHMNIDIVYYMLTRDKQK